MKLSFVNLKFQPPPFNADVFLCKCFFESHPMYDQTQGLGAMFSLIYR
jgi:hypothetical protein